MESESIVQEQAGERDRAWIGPAPSCRFSVFEGACRRWRWRV